MKQNLQKIGGLASLVMASTFIFGMVIFFTLLDAAGFMSADNDPIESAAFLVDNQAIISLWYLVIYVVFGIFLVVLTVALHERLKRASSSLVQVASAFGLIWAGLMFASGMIANVGVSAVVNLYAQSPDQAGLLWLSINSVITGLGGGNEIVGGLWVLLVSWAALKTAGLLPKGLVYLGLIVGATGIFQTLAINIEALGAVFGLGLIVWFIWAGIYLLRSTKN
jgi:hypothetical protein